MNRPRGKTRILRYRTVGPIILPLQFPSRLYNTSLPGSFSLSPYTINIHLPSFPIIFSFALLFSISLSRLPTFRILSHPPHLPVTFILLPTLPRLPTSPCLLVNISRHHQPWTAYTLLSTTSNSKVWSWSTFDRRVFLSPSPSQTPFPRSSGSTLSSGDSLPSTW